MRRREERIGVGKSRRGGDASNSYSNKVRRGHKGGVTRIIGGASTDRVEEEEEEEEKEEEEEEEEKKEDEVDMVLRWRRCKDYGMGNDEADKK
ncbi:hypothetical protein E2C01_038166 [Portunus trituberculatus]|uniref:Uncharacterized protein n=1 Tax=Portunus trituberculatus TaxID=210409 RepID=A0A5B7FHB5_PORTR|nr:hypothetical protein [Portunus trituberculatus]